jgi:hypothetical protein
MIYAVTHILRDLYKRAENRALMQYWCLYERMFVYNIILIGLDEICSLRFTVKFSCRVSPIALL